MRMLSQGKQKAILFVFFHVIVKNKLTTVFYNYIWSIETNKIYHKMFKKLVIETTRLHVIL